MFKDKRGQGLSTNAIILIVLGVAILVMLILGFTIGWQKLLPFIGGDNLQEITTQCDIACKTNQKYAFCTQNRTFQAPDKDDPIEGITCEDLTNATFEDYGMAKCPGLCA
ncbi:hypothetical protein GF378_01775 [Candidatus Pacearchaeota archaeon]|nr:hypothetical protein [Candidatus Pacearchaeota archaeon]